MAEKKIYNYEEKDSTLLYYQQNVDQSTHLLVGFKIPSADLPNEHEHIYRYKNLIVYVDDETNDIRIPLVKPGMLHLMEHSLFHSCEDFKNEELFKYFRKTNTINNAWTSQNLMVLDINCPTKYLEENLELASKMLFRTDYETELQEEKKTVTHELHYVQDRFVTSSLMNLLQNPTLQTGNDIVGIEDQVIDSITANEMARFARTHFTSQNLVMSVVSDLPFEKIEQLCNKYFVEKAPSIPDSKVTPKVPNLKLNDDYILPCYDPGAKTVSLYFYFEQRSDYEESEKMFYLENYLFNGFNGILMDKFRKEKQLTYTPEFYPQDITSNYTLNCFKIQTDVENINTVLQIFTKTMRELAVNGISDEQMNGFKEYWESHRLRKNNLKNRNPEQMLSDYICGNEVFISSMHDKVASITKKEFNEYFKKNYIDTHIVFQPVGNILRLSFPSIETIVSYLRPYENYAYETIYDGKGFGEFVEYLKKLQSQAGSDSVSVKDFKLIKESDYSIKLKELKKEQEKQAVLEEYNKVLKTEKTSKKEESSEKKESKDKTTSKKTKDEDKKVKKELIDELEKVIDKKTKSSKKTKNDEKKDKTTDSEQTTIEDKTSDSNKEKEASYKATLSQNYKLIINKNKKDEKDSDEVEVELVK